jgi:hypothetical protein
MLDRNKARIAALIAFSTVNGAERRRLLLRK